MKHHTLMIAALILLPITSAAASDKITKELITSHGKTVRATRDELNAKGFSVELTELPGHDHWYYDLAPKINRAAWDFLKKYELESDPVYRKFQFN